MNRDTGREYNRLLACCQPVVVSVDEDPDGVKWLEFRQTGRPAALPLQQIVARLLAHQWSLHFPVELAKAAAGRRRATCERPGTRMMRKGVVRVRMTEPMAEMWAIRAGDFMTALENVRAEYQSRYEAFRSRCVDGDARAEPNGPPPIV